MKSHSTTEKIISLIKDGRQVKFPFKFFENNKAELEIF